MIAKLRCSSRTTTVRKLTGLGSTLLVAAAAELDAELQRLSGRVQSTSVALRRRTGKLRRRLRFHAATALASVRRAFDHGLADPFAEVRERSLAPLVADCYQTMSDVERTVKQLTFTSASEVVARKVLVRVT